MSSQGTMPLNSLVKFRGFGQGLWAMCKRYYVTLVWFGFGL